MPDWGWYLIAAGLIVAGLVALVWVEVREYRASDPDLSDYLRRSIAAQDAHNEQVVAEYAEQLDRVDDHFRSLPYLTTACPLPDDAAMAARIYEARAWADITAHLADIDIDIEETS